MTVKIMLKHTRRSWEVATGEVASHISTVTDLLGEGQTIEEVEVRYAPTMHAVDWATVRSTALAQTVPKRGK